MSALPDWREGARILGIPFSIRGAEIPRFLTPALQSSKVSVLRTPTIFFFSYLSPELTFQRHEIDLRTHLSWSEDYRTRGGSSSTEAIDLEISKIGFCASSIASSSGRLTMQHPSCEFGQRKRPFSSRLAHTTARCHATPGLSGGLCCDSRTETRAR